MWTQTFPFPSSDRPPYSAQRRSLHSPAKLAWRGQTKLNTPGPGFKAPLRRQVYLCASYSLALDPIASPPQGTIRRRLVDPPPQILPRHSRNGRVLLFFSGSVLEDGVPPPPTFVTWSSFSFFFSDIRLFQHPHHLPLDPSNGPDCPTFSNQLSVPRYTISPLTHCMCDLDPLWVTATPFSGLHSRPPPVPRPWSMTISFTCRTLSDFCPSWLLLPPCFEPVTF